MGHLDATAVSWPRYAHRGQTRILVVGSMVVPILARFVGVCVFLVFINVFSLWGCKKKVEIV